jgi:hypothetical protein
VPSQTAASWQVVAAAHCWPAGARLAGHVAELPVQYFVASQAPWLV